MYNVQGLVDLPSRFTIPKVKIPNLDFRIPQLRLNLDSVQKINYSKIIRTLDQPILTINLDQIIDELTQIQTDEDSDSESHSRLLNEIVFLNGMNSFIYRPLVHLVNKSLEGIRRVEKMKSELNVKEIEQLIKMHGLSTTNLKTQVSNHSSFPDSRYKFSALYYKRVAGFI